MTQVTLRANQYDYTSSTGVETIGECMKDNLWSCDEMGISSITEEVIVRGSNARTLEGRIRRDIIESYRVWTITYDLLPPSRFNRLKEYVNAQDCVGQCLELDIHNTCDGNCNCNIEQDWIPVIIEMGQVSHSYQGNYENIEIKFTESKSCETC